MKLEKQQKRLYDTYSKRLKKLQIDSIKNPENYMQYFVTYLSLLRDKLVLSLPYPDCTKDRRVVTLAVTIAEFDVYKNCINKYYDPQGHRLSTEETAEAIAEKYNKEKQFHWRAFWQSVAIGMPLWIG